MRRMILCVALVLPAAQVFAGNLPAPAETPLLLAQLVTGTPQQKLQKLLRPHAFYGERVTDDIRAATGNPNIPVIDRRWEFGEIYTCNYTYLKGPYKGRALVCG